MKEKGDECIFVGYSNQSRAYRVFNKRTKVIMESIHVNFDELPQMASDQLSSDPAPECQTMVLNHDSLSPAIQHQENVPQADRTVSTSNELDLLFSLMFDELLNGSSKVVSKSSAVAEYRCVKCDVGREDVWCLLIHAFMILFRILSITLPTPTILHTQHTRLTRVIPVETILN
nr:Gag-Pol polyprotein [Tanacetum cinerariifolium]